MQRFLVANIFKILVCHDLFYKKIMADSVKTKNYSSAYNSLIGTLRIAKNIA